MQAGGLACSQLASPTASGVSTKAHLLWRLPQRDCHTKQCGSCQGKHCISQPSPRSTSARISRASAAEVRSQRADESRRMKRSSKARRSCKADADRVHQKRVRPTGGAACTAATQAGSRGMCSSEHCSGAQHAQLRTLSDRPGAQWNAQYSVIISQAVGLTCRQHNTCATGPACMQVSRSGRTWVPALHVPSMPPHAPHSPAASQPAAPATCLLGQAHGRVAG